MQESFHFGCLHYKSVVIPISEEFDAYAKKINEKINNAGISSEVDLKKS